MAITAPDGYDKQQLFARDHDTGVEASGATSGALGSRLVVFLKVLIAIPEVMFGTTI